MVSQVGEFGLQLGAQRAVRHRVRGVQLLVRLVLQAVACLVDVDLDGMLLLEQLHVGELFKFSSAVHGNGCGLFLNFLPNHAGKFGGYFARVEILFLEGIKFLETPDERQAVFQDPPALRHDVLGIALAQLVEFAVGGGDGGEKLIELVLGLHDDGGNWRFRFRRFGFGNVYNRPRRGGWLGLNCRNDFAFEQFAQLVLQFGGGEFRGRVPEVLHQHTVALVFLKQRDACLVVFPVGEPL